MQIKLGRPKLIHVHIVRWCWLCSADEQATNLFTFYFNHHAVLVLIGRHLVSQLHTEPGTIIRPGYDLNKGQIIIILRNMYYWIVSKNLLHYVIGSVPPSPLYYAD